MRRSGYEKKKLKILLINAIDTSVEVETRYPNLGLAYLVSSAREKLPEVDIEFKIVDSSVEEVVKKYKPDLVGITCVSQNYNIAKSYCSLLNKKNIPTIIGGIHITLAPATLPLSCIAGCIGEGEDTFVELIKAFIIDGKLNESDINKIDGLIYWRKGELVRTRERLLKSNLDVIPLPARDLLDIGNHSYMFTSRGCPYRCTFCASSRFWDKLRFFSAGYVVNEIEELIYKYKVEMISFFDDLFVADRPRLIKIFELLEKKGLIGKVKYTCSCRANLVDKELVILLKKMGVVSVGMGLESGNEEVLKYLKGGTVSVEHNYKAVKLLNEAGIAANGSFVIGSPQETGDQIMDTYNFIKKSGLDLFDVYILTPYPGTPVWEYAKNKGYVKETYDFDWSSLNVNAYMLEKERIQVLSEKLNKKEILEYYRKFRKLRFWHNLYKVVKHPMVKDLPRMIGKMVVEYVNKNIIRK